MAHLRRSAKRTSLQSAADDASVEMARRLGRMLADGRSRAHISQRVAAARAGISQSEWSGLERGRKLAAITTINRAAYAVGGRLDAWIKQLSAADQPRDAVHLRNQELVIRTALAGGWQSLPEEFLDREARTSRAADHPRDAVHLRHQELVICTALAGGWQSLPEEFLDREARTSRAADVLMARRAADGVREYCLCEVWDWLEDVGGAVRDFTRRLDAVDRYAVARMTGDDAVPRTAGWWLVRATQRNRRLIGEHRHFFRARFPGSGRATLAALTHPTSPLPTRPALIWVNVAGTRLYPARWDERQLRWRSC